MSSIEEYRKLQSDLSAVEHNIASMAQTKAILTKQMSELEAVISAEYPEPFVGADFSITYKQGTSTVVVDKNKLPEYVWVPKMTKTISLVKVKEMILAGDIQPEVAFLKTENHITIDLV